MMLQVVPEILSKIGFEMSVNTPVMPVATTPKITVESQASDFFDRPRSPAMDWEKYVMGSYPRLCIPGYNLHHHIEYLKYGHALAEIQNSQRRGLAVHAGLPTQNKSPVSATLKPGSKLFGARRNARPGGSDAC
jgi:hypothetical protein